MDKPVCFGLEGGLGNCLFALPAIKALARRGPVDLAVGGDYPGIIELFQRCVYARNVYSKTVELKASPLFKQYHYLCGQYAPQTGPYVKWSRCGWRAGESAYPHPEWAQIKSLAVGDMEREDVTDWFQDSPDSPRLDVVLIAGCKPGGEWYRKRYPRMGELASRLISVGRRVAAVGLQEEIDDAGLGDIWVGPKTLPDLARALSGAKLVIGTDSGVAQLASSLGVPTVMIFTATSPMKGNPVGPTGINRSVHLGIPCSPCQSTTRWKQCGDWRCRDIPLGRVLDAVATLEGTRLPVIG